MLRTRFLCLLTAIACLCALMIPVTAAEVDCDAAYCFSPADFQDEEPLTGICLMGLPAAQTGTIMLGSRVLRTGDILTAEQIGQMTFSPLRTETDTEAVVTYLPIYRNRVAPKTTMTISVFGKEDKAPVAQDSALETYRNLPNEGMLKASDPEGTAMTFTLVRKPRRGEVVLREDGSFCYTPAKNKVGTDSFTFTAADASGNVSREATVTVQILRPTDSRQYTDTVGQSCRFAAEWMRNTGIFAAEQVGARDCFHPEQAVSRGQFLAMAVDALKIPVEETANYADLTQDAPAWLRPYLAAALRSGLLENFPADETAAVDYEAGITGAEAAVILQNAMDLSVSGGDQAVDAEIPIWAVTAMAAMEEGGISLPAAQTLNRGQAAEILYQAACMADSAPGLAVIRK